MSAVRLSGKLETSFAWDGERLLAESDLVAGPVPRLLRGAAAVVAPGEGGRVLRDPLGINKLFWARGADGGLDFSSRPWQLVEAGHELGEIFAVPRGLAADLRQGEPGAAAESLLPESWFDDPGAEADVEAVGGEIRALLDRYMEALAQEHRSAEVYVCLSGGLDSSGITALVADHFPNATAVSFDIARTGGGVSEDRTTAQRVARDLGLSLLEVTVTPDELLEPLDVVLREGVDWRDFNVHAALVNAALARAVAEEANGAAIVFTGDLANEFLIDYHAEQYKGETYYALPRLEPVGLRAFLVRGLDTSHREVGVFAAWNLGLVQPYAVAVDQYMRLPEEFLRLPDRKDRLCRAIFGDAVPGYVFTRPKTRAQVGDEHERGVLAMCVDRGIDSAALQRRFCELHGGADERVLSRFIRAGRYRAKAPVLDEGADD